MGNIVFLYHLALALQFLGMSDGVNHVILKIRYFPPDYRLFKVRALIYEEGKNIDLLRAWPDHM